MVALACIWSVKVVGVIEGHGVSQSFVDDFYFTQCVCFGGLKAGASKGLIESCFSSLARIVTVMSMLGDRREGDPRWPPGCVR